MALSVADTYLLMIIYAVGTGVGFGPTALAETVLLLNYYGRRNNLEIFSAVCLAGVLTALSQTCLVRDRARGLPTCHSFAGGEVQKPV